jgi:hypothetical protein
MLFILKTYFKMLSFFLARRAAENAQSSSKTARIDRITTTNYAQAA